MLIRFDKKARWYVGFWVALFLIFTLLKIHTISIPVWNERLPDGSSLRKGLLLGTPQAIRMDEYAVGIPWYLSNANRGLPIVNESVGGEKTGLLLLPNRHIFMLFKPALWGFLLLGTEQAVAWNGNFNYMSLLVASFLFLMLMTRSNFYASAFGSLWLWLSSGTQNWNGGAAVIIAFFCLIFVAAALLLFSTKRVWWQWAGLGLLVAWGLCSEIFFIYPPFQVPMGYAFLFMFVGYVLNNRNHPGLRFQFPLKLGVVVLCLAGVGALVYSCYQELKPTLDAVASTVYPGRRLDLGGTGFIANWYSEYFSWLFNARTYPQAWLNICELSHYLTFMPVIIPSVIAYTVLTKRVNWVLVLGCVYVVAMMTWMELGWPKWLAESTLMSMSPTRRAQIPLGVGSVLLAVIYLDYMKDQFRQVSLGINALLMAGVFGFMLYAANVNLDDAGGLFKSQQMFVPVLLFTVMNALLLFTINWRYKSVVFMAGVLLYLLPNLSFNPLAIGLSPILDHSLYKTVKAIGDRDPKAKWVVFGSQFITYMVTATGVETLTGVKYIPPRNVYKVLDPKMRRDSSYNRYAHTVYSTFINGTDSVYIQNNFEDGCMVAMDPCSPRLKTLNVRYVIFDREPQPVEIRCMKLVEDMGSLKIYRIND